MSTEVIEQPAEVAIVESFEFTKQQIAEAVGLANEATVDGPDDTKGMKLAHDYRMGLAKMRTTIDGTRKELKADVLERGRLIERIAKELSSPIPAAEARLKELEETARREQDRLAEIAKHEREQAMKRRMELADEVGLRVPLPMLTTLTDDDFAAAYESRKAEKEAEEKASADLAEQQRVETERLEKAAAELARQQAELAEQQRKQQEEQGRIAAENERRQREIEKADHEAKMRLLTQRVAALTAIGSEHDADALTEMTVDDFTAFYDGAKHAYEQRKAVEADRKRREEKLGWRTTCLSSVGETMPTDQVMDFDDEAFDEYISASRDELAKQKAKDEADRLERERLTTIEAEAEKKRKAEAAAKRKAARAPDREKVVAFSQSVDGLAVPKLKTTGMNERVATAIATLVRELNDIASELLE